MARFPPTATARLSAGGRSNQTTLWRLLATTVRMSDPDREESDPEDEESTAKYDEYVDKVLDLLGLLT